MVNIADYNECCIVIYVTVVSHFNCITLVLFYWRIIKICSLKT